MPDFWQSCGYHLLQRSAEGRLLVTDEYLRAYYMRPELLPVPESCEAERALHAAMVNEPRRRVTEAEIAAIAEELGFTRAETNALRARFRDKLSVLQKS